VCRVLRSQYKLLKSLAKKAIYRVRARQDVVSLRPKGEVRGIALLSTGTQIYRDLARGGSFPTRHAAAILNVEQSQALLDLGFEVDVVDFSNHRFVPSRPYNLCLDVLDKMQHYSAHLPDDCVKVFHPHFSHWLVHNNAVLQRLLAIKERRGIALRPERLIGANKSIEHCDVVTQMGNAITGGTYSHAPRPTLHVRHMSAFPKDWQEERNIAEARTGFVWLGGWGAVCKGLDLALEAFAAMPHLSLHVCGRVDQEKEFAAAYQRELFELPNIHYHGLQDVSSPEFVALTSKCIASVNPSATELCSGSVLDTLHAGLIPLMTPMSGVDLNDYGVSVEEGTVEGLSAAVQQVVDMSDAQLLQRSRAAWEYARSNHLREHFRQDFRSALEEILSGRQFA